MLTEARGTQLLSDSIAFQAAGLNAAGFEQVSLTAKSGESRKVFATGHARLGVPGKVPS